MPCNDFDRFKPLFAQVKREIETRSAEDAPVQEDAQIKPSEFFILGGQMAYIAQVRRSSHRARPTQARLQVIYDNGTERRPFAPIISARALQGRCRAAHYRTRHGAAVRGRAEAAIGKRDEFSLAEPVRPSADRRAAGLIHKIGVTGGDVEVPESPTPADPTYLLAAVEIVATYKLHGNQTGRGLNTCSTISGGPARLEMEIPDRFGKPVKPREWLLAPLSVVDEIVRADTG